MSDFRTPSFFRVLGLSGLVAGLLSAGAMGADFTWSWDQEKGEKAKTNVVEVDPGAEFNWEWNSEGDARRAPAAEGVDAAAYNKVLKENLELRKQVAEKERLEAEAKAKAEQLAADQKTLRGQVNTLAATINSLEREKAAAGADQQRVRELEQKLDEAEKARKQLAEQMSGLQQRLEVQRDETVSAAAPALTVAPDSDLFKKLEQENALLKQQMAEMEDARAKALLDRERILEKEEVVDRDAVKIKEREDKLKEELKATKSTSEEQQKMIGTLMERIPVMERELEALRSTSGGDAVALAAREREIANVREELRRREYRLIKAERMAAMLDQAQAEVQSISEQQRRDMHYNMAVVYAKEGRARDAEAEYLKALRVDPSDPAAHYNLAILYDDELKDKNRAAMHYRKYLQLQPEAPDRDQVREWIMRLEMK